MGGKREDGGVSIIYWKYLVSEGQNDSYPQILRPPLCSEHRLSLTQNAHSIHTHAHTEATKGICKWAFAHAHTHKYSIHPCAQLTQSHKHAEQKTAPLQSTGRSLISWCKTRTPEMKMERKKNHVACYPACPDPSKRHPPSPLRILCLCIWKSFCCCGCSCCFQSTKAVATTSQISDGRGGEFSEWQLLCCMIYYLSKSERRPWSSLMRRWTNAVIFLSKWFVIWSLTHWYVTAPETVIRKIQLTLGPER